MAELSSSALTETRLRCNHNAELSVRQMTVANNERSQARFVHFFTTILTEQDHRSTSCQCDQASKTIIARQQTSFCDTVSRPSAVSRATRCTTNTAAASTDSDLTVASESQHRSVITAPEYPTSVTFLAVGMVRDTKSSMIASSNIAASRPHLPARGPRLQTIDY